MEYQTIGAATQICLTIGPIRTSSPSSEELRGLYLQVFMAIISGA